MLFIGIFIGLNGVRILSVVSLLLVFASNISTLVKDVKAVNAFMEAGKAIATGTASNATKLEELMDFDYITYVLDHVLSLVICSLTIGVS